MTVRNKALGRAKGPFAATTYIRGDVVNFAGALYAAKESFTATQTFNPTDWDEVLAAPSSAFVKATIGPGLPSLADRTNGDLHYDTQARKLFAHIGVAGGVLLSDNFNRADGALNGTTTTTGNVVWEGFGAVITGNRMRFQSGSSYFGYIALNTGGYNNDLSANVTFTTSGDGSYGGEFEFGLESKGDEGMGNIQAPYKLKMYLANGATTASFHVYGPGGKVKADGTYVTGTAQQISDYVTGTVTGISAARPITIPVRFSIDVNGRLRAWINGNLVFNAIVEIALPQNKGTHVMLTGSSYYWNGVYYDDLLAGALGTLEWAESQIDAANIVFTPIGGISATNVKAALAELDAEKAPLAHTHTGRTGSAAVNTLGAGLPGLLSRQNGDLHLDTTVGRAFMHSGSPGSQITAASGSIASTDIGAGDQTVEFDMEWTASTSSSARLARDDATNSHYDFDINPSIANGALRIYIYRRLNGVDTHLVSQQGGITIPPSVGTKIHVILEKTATVVRMTLINLANQVTYVMSYDITGATVNGAKASVSQGASSIITNAVAAGNGNLAWASTEPIYLQAHLVSGNVAVANHVLKPGVRVPSACALKEVVLRCETAPVGASLTVTVERFNGGVSQGVIATVSIPTGENVGSTVGLNAACAKGDILKFNVTSVGSTTAGADLTASLDLR